MESKFKLSSNSLAKLQGVHPDLVKVVQEAIKYTPVDFGISQGVRTLEMQKALYAQGRTTPGPIVTWTMNSKHLVQADGFGHAIDIVAYVNGKVNWETYFYDTISDVILACAEKQGVKIKWGGDFTKNKDRPHYELVT